MDERAAREHIDAHARALVAGDLARAASDFGEDYAPGGAKLVAQLPPAIAYAELTMLEQRDGQFIARVRYAGGGAETDVEERWEKRGSRLLLVEARVV